MKKQNSPQRSTKIRLHCAASEHQVITLDREVLALDPRRSFWEEGDIEWEWEHIEPRGNRKPSLDDYDRWPLQICFLTRDEIRCNH
jgi:hypothetical protein